MGRLHFKGALDDIFILVGDDFTTDPSIMPQDNLTAGNGSGEKSRGVVLAPYKNPEQAVKLLAKYYGEGYVHRDEYISAIRGRE